MFLLNLAISVVKETDILTSEDRKTAIVIDDTAYYRDRSKRMELLFRFKDHSKNCYYKGFTLLTMGWSDGQTFLPLDYRVLANAYDKKLIEGSHVKEDRRTLATKRRKDAREISLLWFLKCFLLSKEILRRQDMFFLTVGFRRHQPYFCTCCDKHPELKDKYQALKKRRGGKKAVIAISRKILTVIWHILSKNEHYNVDLYTKADKPPVNRALTPEQAFALLRIKGYQIVEPKPAAETV